MFTFFQKLRKALTSPIDDFQHEQRERRKNALIKLSSLTNASRNRFPEETLLCLLDAGWNEGRVWGDQPLTGFTQLFDLDYPQSILKVLTEFGGLSIGFYNRTIDVGNVEEELRSSYQVSSTLVGVSLFPIGRTNIFEDDGLAVLASEDGRIFVDGETGSAPPNDQRLDYIAASFSDALNKILAKEKTKFDQTWSYTLPTKNMAEPG